jgi:hypothetical protein
MAHRADIKQTWNKGKEVIWERGTSEALAKICRNREGWDEHDG